ncbi:uncharacterized protein LOC132266107 isoform X1 [Phlebotomus argentipes]|uniref:uncharacterized protein LOC132266107 isoform X1 n=1 Tax=Phlebotomus argentipes TaxID=94469 RepID=UPI002892D59E|nr:uncharacterized protein LOC132266107 isoform X1 [Phlebotomus argentipes]
MASTQIRENVSNHFVPLCSILAILCMIVTVLGIKLRWFRHRLTFDRLPTAPKRDSTEETTVVVTGFYRKSADFDTFVAIERPQTLPREYNLNNMNSLKLSLKLLFPSHFCHTAIRLDKRSTQRNSHLLRNTILITDNGARDGSKATPESDISVKEVEKEVKKSECVVENVVVSKKKAPQPPAIAPVAAVQENLPQQSNHHHHHNTAEASAKRPEDTSSNHQAVQSSKKKSIFSITGPEEKIKGTKVRVLKQKHTKGKEKVMVVEKKKDRPSIMLESNQHSDKILAESTIFTPVAIPRNNTAINPINETQDQTRKQLQFAPEDEIIGQSENYDSWDLVSRHRQSLNHLSAAPAPKPRARDSVAYHKQKVAPIILDDDDDRPPKTLREMQKEKEREKLSLARDYSDTEA